MGMLSKKEKTPRREYDGPRYMGLSGSRLAAAIGLACGSGFLLFGYDQGVMGSLLTLPSFTEVFPEIDTTRGGSSGGATSSESTLQGLTIGLYEIGCMIGALSCLWLGDLLGRRAIIWIGSIWMIVGAIIQTASFSIGQLIAGRVVGGVGNGMHTCTIPMYLSEMSAPHKRGKLVMIEGLLITGGIALSYWIDFAFYWLDPASRLGETIDQAAYNELTAGNTIKTVAWRFPIAFQIVLTFPSFLVFVLPESPRWLLLKGRDEEAREVMSALDELDRDDPLITAKIKEVKASIAETMGVGLKDLFTFGPERFFHRATLGWVIQMFQQISGINLITYYASVIYENNIGLSPLVSRIVAPCNGTEYFLASFIAIYTIEKFGRRKLMLFGALGQSLSMAVLAITNAPIVTRPEIINGVEEATNTGASVVAAIFLFVFNTFFAIGWLGMTWLYPAEIAPLAIRAAANGISTSSNWLWNFVIVLITPIMFEQIGHETYVVFAVINFGIFVATFFIFPETAGRSLEEIDVFFEKASKVNPYDVVRIARKTPRRYDERGNLIDADVRAEHGFAGTPEDEKKRQGELTATADASSRASST